MRLGCLALILLTQPLRAQPLAADGPVRLPTPEAAFLESWTLEDTLAIQAADKDPFERLEAIIDGLNARGQDPSWVGMISNPDRDPEGNQPTLYVLREDSTVWVRAPSGRSAVLDNYVMMELGLLASERTAYGDRPPEGFGYGRIDGRIYIYASQGVDITLAIVLAVLTLLFIPAAFVWLARSLRRSRERERASIEARMRLTEAREEERLRIAREIHDGPVQDLHAMRLMMGPNAEGTLGKEALQVIHNLRALSENLRPPALATMGLYAAVESFVGRVQHTHPEIEVSVEVEGPVVEPPQRLGLALFRVVQEGINNAVHHAGPRSIWVRIVFEPEGVRVAVEDDGSGFDVPPDLGSLGVDGHFGLLGMSERAASLDGYLEVRTRDGGGTRVEAWLPHPVQTN